VKDAYVCPCCTRPVFVAVKHNCNKAAGVSKGWVYFVQAEHGGPIKIGYTEGAPQKRVASLQTASPARLRLVTYTVGDREKEREIHNRFSRARLNGEWFSADADGLPELIAYYQAVRAALDAADAEYFAVYGS
jgi:hypothetical protein